MQYAVSTRYIVSGSRFVVADAKLARRLGCSPGRRWLHTEGLRYAPDGSPPICRTEVYVHAAYAGVRSLIGKRTNPIYTLIEEMYDERVVEVVQTLRAVTVPQALAAKLAVPAGSGGARNRAGLQVRQAPHPRSGVQSASGGTVQLFDLAAARARLKHARALTGAVRRAQVCPDKYQSRTIERPSKGGAHERASDCPQGPAAQNRSPAR